MISWRVALEICQPMMTFNLYFIVNICLIYKLQLDMLENCLIIIHAHEIIEYCMLSVIEQSMASMAAIIINIKQINYVVSILSW